MPEKEGWRFPSLSGCDRKEARKQKNRESQERKKTFSGGQESQRSAHRFYNEKAGDGCRTHGELPSVKKIKVSQKERKRRDVGALSIVMVGGPSVESVRRPRNDQRRVAHRLL